jgi:hypothetical protein
MHKRHSIGWGTGAVKRFGIALALTGMLCTSAFAWASPKTQEQAAVDTSRLSGDALSLTEHFDILEDPTAALTWADVQTDAVAAVLSR